jgi:hypothetical protein
MQGQDKERRPVIIVVGSHMPAKRVDLERVLMFIISKMDRIVESDYSIIYVHSNISAENKPGFMWLKKVYGMLGRKYKKNLKSLYIIHPTNFIKRLFAFFKPFISGKFWKKLHYIDDLAALSDAFDLADIELPSVALT